MQLLLPSAFALFAAAVAVHDGPRTPPAPLKLDNVRLLVTKFDETFAFYRDVVGLKPTSGKPGDNYASFVFADGAQIALLVTTEAYGTYHATCQGECSWYQFAAEIFRQSGLDPELGPTTSAERITPARRPPYSVLENRNLQRQGIDVMPHWKEALRHYLHERSAQAPTPTLPQRGRAIE